MKKKICSILACCSIATSSLIAVEVEEVIQLHKAGVKPNIIINMMKNTPTKAPSVQEIIALQSSGVPDEVITAYSSLNTKVVPQLEVKRTVTPEKYDTLMAQRTAFTSKTSKDNAEFHEVGNGSTLLFMLRDKKEFSNKDLIEFAYMHSDAIYKEVKNDEFKLKERRKYLEETLADYIKKHSSNVSDTNEVYIGEYDFTKKVFHPDWFRGLKQSYCTVYGIQYSFKIVNEEDFKELPLDENEARKRLSYSPNRMVKGNFGYEILGIENNTVLLKIVSISLMRDQVDAPFYSRTIGEKRESEFNHHPLFPDDKFGIIGDYPPSSEPSNLRIMVKKGNFPDLKIRSFHDRRSENLNQKLIGLTGDERIAYFKAHTKERAYDMPFENGKSRFVPVSKDEWVYLFEPKSLEGFKFDSKKLNVVVIEKGLFNTKLTMIYLDPSQRELFENGSLEQIEKR